MTLVAVIGFKPLFYALPQADSLVKIKRSKINKSERDVRPDSADKV